MRWLLMTMLWFLAGCGGSVHLQPQLAPWSGPRVDRRVLVVTPLRDVRPDNWAKVGVMRNAYGWDVMEIKADSAVGPMVDEAIAAALGSAGFSVRRGAAPVSPTPLEPVVSGQLEFLFGESLTGAFGLDLRAEVAVTLQVETQGAIYTRRFVGQAQSKPFFGSAGDFEAQISAAVADVAEQITGSLVALFVEGAAP